jgi:hypothetical protein
MSDLYLTVTDQPHDVLDAIAAAMDARMADPGMRDICVDLNSQPPHHCANRPKNRQLSH